MPILLLISFMVMLCTSCGQRPSNLASIEMVSSKMIYGSYDLIPANQSPRDRLKLGQSVAIMMTNNTVKNLTSDNYVNINLASTLGVNQTICATEPLANEKNFGNCTGFLVHPKVLMTASHCLGDSDIEAQQTCSKYSWAFGVSEDKLSALPLSNIRKCGKVLEFNRNSDYALIELDLPYTNSAPLKLAKVATQNINGLYSYSYPKGTPMKYTDHIEVQNISRDQKYIYVSGEFYKSSSGSPVFNDQDEVVGILRAGSEDFKNDTARGCKVSIHASGTEHEILVALQEDMLQSVFNKNLPMGHIRDRISADYFSR